MRLIENVIRRVPASWLNAAAESRMRSRVIRRCTDVFAAAFRNRDVQVTSGPASGLRINTGATNLGYLLAAAEPDVQAALQLIVNPGMTVYDIGANVGFYTILASKLAGPAGRVIAFEPLPRNFALVKHNLEVNGFGNSRCLPFAIGMENGTARFLVSEQHSWGMLANGSRRPGQYSGELPVEIRRLDSILQQERVAPPDVIKMDIEGGEAAALAGAHNILSRFRPLLVIELHCTTEVVLHELDHHGYRASLLGSAAPVRGIEGSLHIAAIPAERSDADSLIDRLQEHSFPRCKRCTEVHAQASGPIVSSGRDRKVPTYA